MFQLSKWWARRKSVPIRRSKVGRHLTVERLETRDLPATWTPLATMMPSSAGGAQQLELLSDGTVLIQGGSDGASANWYRLTPNSSGSYINGAITTTPYVSHVARLFFTSDVLPSGNVFVFGGEYSGPNGGSETDNNTGEIFNPVTNTWTNAAVFPQSFYGDVPSEVLPNGTVLTGSLQGPQSFIYNPTSNSWSQTGDKLNNDQSDEENWVKLPNGNILTYDIWYSIAQGTGYAQQYVPSTGSWINAGTYPVPLSNTASYELGPGVLLPDGRVFYTGATGNNALYTPSTNTWAAAPATPNGRVADDNPAAVLPNGHVLYLADLPYYTGPTQVFDFDPVANTITQSSAAIPSALATVLNNYGAYDNQMLDLPNGDILLSDGTSQLWQYTPDGSPNAAWRPTISSVAYNGNQTYTLTGTQLNGMSEGAYYGDDAEMASNYPIVQLTNGNSVYYARTFNWSSTGVQTGNTLVTTQFTLPANLPFATYSLSVIANGIASTTPVSFTPPIYVDTHFTTANYPTGAIGDADPVNTGNQPATIGINAFATVGAAITAAPSGALVIVNGANGTTGSGVFNEPVVLSKPVNLYLQQGAVSFGSLAGSVTSANVILNVPLTVGIDNTNTEFDGAITGPSGFTKTGGGTLTLTASESFAGVTTISGGNLLVGGSLSSASAVTVAGGATLSGPGTIGGTTTVNGMLAPGNGVGVLTTGQLTFSATSKLSINVMGPTAGANYSQVVANGPVNVTGATLTVSVAGGFIPSPTTPIDILVNQSGTAIVGTFAGLAEGATVTANGAYFTISYLGGTSGHDIVLTPTTPPTVAAIQVNDGSAQRSEVQSIAVTFSGPLTFAGSGTVNANAAAAFQLQHIQDATNVLLSAVVSADSQNRTVVTLTFSGSEIDPLSVANNGIASLADGRYQLTILSANVTAANGLTLDGDGDGIAGGNYVSPTDTRGGGPGQLQLYRLFGDATGDGTVDSQDLGQFRSTYNAGTGASSYLAYLDADNSGFVDSQDLGQFRSRYNTSVFS